jgi:hypothetical protein
MSARPIEKRAVRVNQSIVLTISLGLTVFAVGASAKTKRQKAEPPQDQIQVVAHIPLGGGQINAFVSTRHYSRDYLYAEHQSGTNVTLIDVTKPNSPAVLAEAAYPGAASSDGLVAVAGSVALVADNSAPIGKSNSPRTIRIMSFVDPAHPTIQQEFTGVTAMGRDDRRGLIFLANADGLWVLQESLALDPAVEAQWEHDMLGNR